MGNEVYYPRRVIMASGRDRPVFTTPIPYNADSSLPRNLLPNPLPPRRRQPENVFHLTSPLLPAAHKVRPLGSGEWKRQDVASNAPSGDGCTKATATPFDSYLANG